jgi:hypothetical protein
MRHDEFLRRVSRVHNEFAAAELCFYGARQPHEARGNGGAQSASTVTTRQATRPKYCLGYSHLSSAQRRLRIIRDPESVNVRMDC